MSQSKIVLRDRNIRLSKLDNKTFDGKKKAYEKRLEELQQKMLLIQQAYHHQGHRAVMLFEGWDAAGKGGAIRRLTAMLDPRGYKVYPISAPEPTEQGKHYLYRFWRLLPEPGHIAILDRSWYGRVLVERVEGFAKRKAWRRAYDEINELERTLVDDSARVVKVFLHITGKQQNQRFAERLANPYKRWKLTPDDLRNREKRQAYTKAIETMFDRTDTDTAPWHVVAANSKRYARLKVLEIAIKALGKGIDVSAPVMDPDFLAEAREILGVEADE